MNHHRYIINTSSPIAESRTGRILSAIDRLATTTTTTSSTDSSSSSSSSSSPKEVEAEVALKFVFAPNSESNGLSHALLRESATWALLSAKAEMFEEKRTTTTDKREQKQQQLPILKLRDVFACGSSVVFVSKRMKSDLHSYLFSKNNKINNNLHTIKHIARRILVGLDFMHRECNVVHRDLKTSNIFVDYCCDSTDDNDLLLLPEVMIGDFGLSRVCSTSNGSRKRDDDDDGDHESRTTRPMTHEVVTRAYRPPELFLGCCQYHQSATTREQQILLHPATSIDMWSFGCIMIDLLMSLTYAAHDEDNDNTTVHPPPSPLFASSSSSDIEQLSKIYDLIGTPSNDCQRKLLSMMKNNNNNNNNNTNNSNNSIISFAPRAPYHPQWGEEIGKLYLSSEENNNNSNQCKLFGDFIQRLLCNDPSDRMSAKECLDHAFLK